MQDTIEREFEALRDIKRRSSSQGGPGSLRLDPDLPASPAPSAAPPLSPQAWTEGPTAVSPTRRTKSLTKGATDTSGSAAGDAPNANGDAGEDGPAVDPFHLYWVPAHLHPELAPTEFRDFLKEHAHGPPADGSSGSEAGETGELSARMPGGTAIARSNSQLGRKRSMLSRQYKPRANDGVEEEHVVPSRRKSMFVHDGPQLTINDLQKLEELADEASRSDDPTKLRRMLRRSMSMNVAPSFLDQIDDVNEPQDEADAPIIVPPPNQILRRTARTKIRKPNLSGDGGGHRFPTTRRKSGGAARQNSVDTVVSPTDGSSSGHSGEKEDTVPSLPALRRPPKVDAEGDSYDANHRLTYTEETSIFDAYADEPEDVKSISRAEATPMPPTIRPVDLSTQTPPTTIITEPEPEPVPPSEPSQPPPQPATPNSVPILHQPQPQKRLSPQQQQVLEQDRQPSRTPSPDSSTGAHEITRPESRSSVISEGPSHFNTSSSTLVHDKRKEKDKKSLWRKVGGSSDKQSKKASKEEKKEKEREKEKEKEKETSGFFNSIFGGGKKKQEDAPPPSNMGGGAGPATAAAMLGASKSKQPYSPTLSPQLGNPYARYPIHVERAVYRLSHIKLANPRRPLYEQVLISNLMFWYLGVINKANQPQGQQPPGAQGVPGQQGAPQAGAQGVPGQENAPSTGAGTSEREHMEREQAEREQRERAEREERERTERERAEAGQKRDSGGKRGSLTKPATGAGARRSEVAVKGPQYHLQSQVIEQEYGSSTPVRVGSAPPPSMNGPQQGGSGAGYKRPGAGGKHVDGPPNGNSVYYGRSNSLDMGSGAATVSNMGPSLPPGAMPPVSSSDQLWLASQSVYGSPPQQYTSQTTEWNNLSQPSPQNQQQPRIANSPSRGQGENMDWRPERDHTSSAKTPMRSLSANAVSPNSQSSNNYAQYNQFGYQQQSVSGNDVYGGIEPQQQPGAGYGAMKKKPSTIPDRDWNRQQKASEDEDVPLAMWHQQQQRRK